MYDIITKFDYKKKTWLSPRHPLYFEDENNKIIYISVVLMFAQLNKTINPLNNYEFNRLMLKGLGLNPDKMSRIMAGTNNKESIIDSLTTLLDTKNKKYIFLLDIFNVGIRSKGYSEEEKQAIDIYSKLLSISNQEKYMLEEFILNSFVNNDDKCVKIFENMLEFSMDISMSELKYFLPSIKYVDVIDDRIVYDGEQLEITHDCKVMGNIRVLSGGKLVIRDANMKIYGTIIVDSAYVDIESSSITYMGSENKVLLSVNSDSSIVINKATFNGSNRSGVIYQFGGNLKISKSSINNTNVYSAIYFNGNNAIISKCEFINCCVQKNGAAIYKKSGRVNVSQCSFVNCKAIYGGAIFAKKGTRVTLCSFKSCNAIKFGHSIFFIGEIGSRIARCMFEEGIPNPNEVVQYIGKNTTYTVNDEKWLKYSSIFENGFVVNKNAILNIENCNIYLGQGAKVEGTMNMNSCHVEPVKFNGLDLIDISNANESEITNCEFDGKDSCSIFRATGTRININKCYFINVAKGRAIYNCMESSIIDSIFSFCDHGGVYMNGGKVLGCTFINCRGDKGAGIELKGNRAVVKNCKFIRCIASISSGGISSVGNNRLEQLAFKECKPNNI